MKDHLLKHSCVIDTETTSLNFREAEIIELGFALYDGAWEHHSIYYKPSTPISPKVSAVTNIINEDVEDCESFAICYTDFDDIMEAVGTTSDVLIVAHNAFYDNSVFKHMYSQSHVLNYDWLCTMRLAKKLFSGDDTVEEYNLPYLRYRFELDIPRDMPHHRAGTDAYITAKLFEYLVGVMEDRGLLDQNGPYKDQIIEYVSEPIIIDRMPFGKHKGKLIKDVPMDYWTWALNNVDSLQEDKDEYDPDFAASVAKVLEEKLG